MANKLTPRNQAMLEERTRYFTGMACPRGHVSERMVSTRACVACIGEKKLAWSSSNPGKVNAQKRNWCAANPEKVRALKSAEQKRNRSAANARGRRWYAANRERANAASAAWAQANPGKCTAKQARRRARVLQATPAWADHDLMDAYYELAAIYREHTPLDVHVDHDIPLQGKRVCGLHVHTNLQTLDAGLNRSKSNRFNLS